MSKYNIKKSLLAIIFCSILIISTLPLPACSPTKETGLIINKYSVWGDQLLCASMSVKDTKGELMTGLELEDFTLIEELLNPSGDVVDTKEVTFHEPDYQFEGKGFWERSVTREKMDIVFAIDGTGSMSEVMPKIRSELHDFVDRLLSQHVDFCVAFIVYGSTIADWFIMPFMGVMEAQEIHDWINDSITSGGEWFEPAFGYDALMYATQLGYREDVKNRTVVIISDSIPQSVYGTHWYIHNSTAACYSAVKEVIEQYGVQLYYSQPDGSELEHLEYYVKPNPQYEVEFQNQVKAGHVEAYELEVINPRAMDSFTGLGNIISWPFEAEDIPIANDSIVDSQYYFSWVSNLDLPYETEDYQVRVTAKVIDTEKPGGFLENTFSYIPYLETANLEITMKNEIDELPDDVWVYIMREMGDRHAYDNPYWQLEPKNGRMVIENIPISDYYVYAETSGSTDYHYYSLRYVGEDRINISKKGLTTTLQLDVGDKVIEIAKVRGLLKDLDDWQSPGDPFKEFVQESEQWLASIEDGGITWQEMVSIKRFYIGLSCYTNLTQYAERQTEAAIENFYQIVQDIRDIIEQVKSFGESKKESFKEKVAAALLEGLLDVLTGGQFSEVKAAVEIALDELVEYAGEELLSDLIDEVIEQIPSGPCKPLIIIMVSTLVDADFKDRGEVLDTLVDILDGLSEALDAFSTFYPLFRDEAKSIHDLITVLDGLQVIPRAIEFGLMLDALDTLGDEAKLLYYPVFP